MTRARPGAPLAGRTVVVTRPAERAGDLAERLAARGARPIRLPVIRTIARPTDAAELAPLGAGVERYGTVILTSAAGAIALEGLLGGPGALARRLAAARVVAIGPATAAALAGAGRPPDVTAARATAEGVVAALRSLDVASAPVLLARGAEGREVIPDALRARGATVDVVALYRTVCVGGPLPVAAAEVAAADAVTFASASAASCFARRLGGALDLAAVRGVSIGPPTSTRMRDVGLPVAAEAARHDAAGLVEAVERLLAAP